MSRAPRRREPAGPHLGPSDAERSMNVNDYINVPAHGANQTFQQFPLLPPEIRQKIWALVPYTTPNRILPLAIGTSSPPLSSKLKIYVYSPLVPPALLSVNGEARRVAQKHYRLSFGTLPDHRNAIVASPPRVYFNGETDLPWIDAVGGGGGGEVGGRYVGLVGREGLKGVRSLAVGSLAAMVDVSAFEGLVDGVVVFSGVQHGECSREGRAFWGRGLDDVVADQVSLPGLDVPRKGTTLLWLGLDGTE